MDLIFKGIITGFILSIMIGPVFFVLLETSIRRGVKAAIAFDIGVLLNDIVYILIAYIFYNQVAELSEGEDNSILRLIGGGLFLLYGVTNFFKKVKETKMEGLFKEDTSTRDLILLALKGFLLNLANPLVVFYWFSVMTLGAQDVAESGSFGTMIMFISSILITFFAIDILKILGAKKLRPLVTRKVLIGLNRVIGIVFVTFGVILIIQGLIGVLK